MAVRAAADVSTVQGNVPALGDVHNRDGDFPNEPHIMLQSHTEVQDLNYKTDL